MFEPEPPAWHPGLRAASRHQWLCCGPDPAARCAVRRRTETSGSRLSLTRTVSYVDLATSAGYRAVCGRVGGGGGAEVGPLGILEGAGTR